jgi:hypothetical protein
MACSRFVQVFTKYGSRAFQSSRLIALALLAVLPLVTMQPAQAQNSDTWKSIAIIGGSTAAGAYIGHKVGGSTGALIGAGAGAAAGYAIDRHRRSNDYNQYSYGDSPYYGNDGYYQDGGYYGPYDPGAYPYPSGFRSSNYYANSNRCSGRR